MQNEGSENALGLRTAGSSRASSGSACGCCCSASLSVLLRLIVYLFGEARAEEVDLQIGHAELEV